jgi:hypothetical protein
MFHNIDQWVINRIQTSYLWLYDWTGVYVASVAVISFLLGKAIAGFRVDSISLCLTIWNIVVLIPMYLLQDKGNYKRYNRCALIVQGLTVRLVFTWSIIFIGIIEICMLDFRQACNSFALVFYMYSTCICIREREPKEWFKQYKLATEKS